MHACQLLLYEQRSINSWLPRDSIGKRQTQSEQGMGERWIRRWMECSSAGGLKKEREELMAHLHGRRSSNKLQYTGTIEYYLWIIGPIRILC